MDEKDIEIARLRRKVKELRLYKRLLFGYVYWSYFQRSIFNVSFTGINFLERFAAMCRSRHIGIPGFNMESNVSHYD